MVGFEWIGEIVHALLAFLPRYVHVAQTQAGVMYTRKVCCRIGPGIHWYWPFWSDIEVEEKNIRSLGVAAQNLITKDRVKLTVSVAVDWRIVSVMKALVRTEDFEATMLNVSQGCVTKVVMGHTFDELLNYHSEVCAELTEMIDERMTKYGIRVTDAEFTDLCDALIISTVTT